ncbi:FecR domain-containing protein [Fulvivirgaceae bacterium BMA12]|uniref:FecR domain-containing protein n=1 Tax=Agaribacillus aureus TaxID=3051825 RepID=A0ABT8L572_9BACT|nr:FecR domain-containing protein [Fulvivirgaceae bacterium BMA12]
MDKQNDIIQLIQKYWDNSYTDEEYDAVIDFLRRPDAGTLIERWEKEGKLKSPAELEELSGTTESDESIDSQLNVSKLLSMIFEHENRLIAEKKKRPPMSGYLKAAVIVLVTGVLAWFLMDLDNQSDSVSAALLTKETARGQKITLTLSDGTTVQMNSESVLIYPREFQNTREVTLKGEAFFMVTRDEQKPFIVKTGDVKTEVLGTSFNIKAFERKSIEVTVVSGKVKVKSNLPIEEGASPNTKGEKNEITLLPDQQAIYHVDSNLLKKSAINATDFIAWKEGMLKFSEVRFEEVAEDLERWYGVDIAIDSRLNDCIIIGEYQNESLESILKSFEFLMDINYEFSKDGVTIHGEGC